MTTLSSQQSAVINYIENGKSSAVVEAVAGAGKTYTLIEILKTIKDKKVLFCAFSAAIAAEIKDRIQPFGFDNCKVSTVHSFGLASYRRFQTRLKTWEFKLNDIAREDFRGEFYDIQGFAVAAADMAKQVGIGPLQNIDNDAVWFEMCEHFNLFDSLPEKYSSDRGIDAARYLLNQSNQVRDIVDYSDMIYLPILHKCRTEQFDYILLDEAQDTNPTRRALVKMALKPQGRLIAVGDPHQAIFGFTGADSDALDRIKQDFNAVTLPLSVTYRCPKNVVEVANRWVSHIEAHESAPDGIVDSCELQDIAKLASKDDAVICRLTKPLVELAYSLLRQNVACKVEGRKIGEGLINICKKWKTVKTVGQLQAKVEEWAQREITKHKAKGNDSRCQNIEDQAQTLGVFIAQCDDSDPVSILIGKIQALFGDTKNSKQNVLTLSTIHRTKGREWDRVFCLGMDTYSPSKWARQAWEMEQEDNLCYVQVTRAKKHLTMVTVPPKQRD